MDQPISRAALPSHSFCDCVILLSIVPLSEVSELKTEFTLHLQDTGINMREPPAPRAPWVDKFVYGSQCPVLGATRWHSRVVVVWSDVIAMF